VWRVFASEPDVALSPSGDAVMWFSMNLNNTLPPGGAECTEGCTDGSTNPACNSNYTRGQNFTTFVSWTLDPGFQRWSTPLVIEQGTVTSQDTNMAAVVLRNGSVVGLYRSKQFGGLHRVTAADYRVPASYMWHEHEPPLMSEAAHPLAPEDPYVWTTPAGPMGVDGRSAGPDAELWYHALFHHRSCTAPWVNRSYSYATVACGGLAYSADGVRWHYAGTVPHIYIVLGLDYSSY
jgi:hypothetical protein